MLTNEQLEKELLEWESIQIRIKEEAEEFIQAWYKATKPIKSSRLHNLSNNAQVDNLVELLDKVLDELKWSSSDKGLIKKLKYNMINTNKEFNRNHIALLTLMEQL